MPDSSRPRAAPFTVIELIAVLVIAGIAAAIALPSLTPAPGKPTAAENPPAAEKPRP